MDLGSYQRWYDYSRARDMMLKATDILALRFGALARATRIPPIFILCGERMPR